MDAEGIVRVIELYNKTCPAFTYKCPLLEKKVAKLCATSLLTLSKSSKVSNRSRSFIINTIRELCRGEPSDHLCIDDDVTEILMKCYEEHLKNSVKNQSIDEMLDKFLIRDLKEMNISALHAPAINPETIQALTNLKGSRRDMEPILLKYVDWNICDKDKDNKILKSIWNAEILPNYNGIREMELVIPNDSAIKMKPLIEELILDICYEILHTQIIDLKDWCEGHQNLQGLVKMCSDSSEWFQICSSIINSIFIKVNFDKELLLFIDLFINDFVRTHCKKLYFSNLYPTSLSYLVTLLDINIINIPTETQKSYITFTCERLWMLHNECKNDLIMLLSHFEQWFSIYHSYLQENNLSSINNNIFGALNKM